MKYTIHYTDSMKFTQGFGENHIFDHTTDDCSLAHLWNLCAYTVEYSTYKISEYEYFEAVDEDDWHEGDTEEDIAECKELLDDCRLGDRHPVIFWIKDENGNFIYKNDLNEEDWLNAGEMHKVEFVSYTGMSPNYCHGILSVRVDGVHHRFGESEVKADPDDSLLLPPFWKPTPNCRFDSPGDDNKTWELKEDALDLTYPPEVKARLEDILEAMNRNVFGGCCKGCTK